MTKVGMVEYKLFVSRIGEGLGKSGWEISDESGDVVEGPFVSRQEARDYLRDLQSGKVQLGEQGRYMATAPLGNGVTQKAIDAGKVAQTQYEANLVKWRAGRK